MEWLIARLAEPSTWAGLAAIVPALVSVAQSPGGVSPETIGAIAAGVAAAVMREGKKGA